MQRYCVPINDGVGRTWVLNTGDNCKTPRKQPKTEVQPRAEMRNLTCASHQQPITARPKTNEHSSCKRAPISAFVWRGIWEARWKDAQLQRSREDRFPLNSPDLFWPSGPLDYRALGCSRAFLVLPGYQMHSVARGLRLWLHILNIGSRCSQLGLCALKEGTAL